MTIALRVFLLFVLGFGALADATAAQNGRGTARSGRQGGDGSYFHRHGYTKLDIPKGHYPPPGECRVWYPNRPPGHQPPPGNCRTSVPRGAWLIRHPHDNPDHVHVVVYDEHRPSTVLAIGEFRIGTGVFVRVVVDR